MKNASEVMNPLGPVFRCEVTGALLVTVRGGYADFGLSYHAAAGAIDAPELMPGGSIRSGGFGDNAAQRVVFRGRGE